MDENLTGKLSAVGTLTGVLSPGQVGGDAKLQSKSVSPARTAQTVLPDEGFDGLSEVNISPVLLENKTVDVTQQGQTVKPSAENDGLASVTINPAYLQYKYNITPSDSSQIITPDTGYFGLAEVNIKAITLKNSEIFTATAQRQEFTPVAPFVGYKKVIINALSLQSKTVTPTTQQQVIRADSGYSGLGSVVVEAASGGQKIVCNATGAFSASMKSAFETLENIEKIEFTSVESFASADLSTIGKNNAVDVYLSRAAGTECVYWPFNTNAAQDVAHKITLHVPANLLSAYGSSQMGNWYEFPYSGYEYFEIVGDL